MWRFKIVSALAWIFLLFDSFSMVKAITNVETSTKIKDQKLNYIANREFDKNFSSANPGFCYFFRFHCRCYEKCLKRFKQRKSTKFSWKEKTQYAFLWSFKTRFCSFCVSLQTLEQNFFVNLEVTSQNFLLFRLDFFTFFAFHNIHDKALEKGETEKVNCCRKSKTW